MAAIGAIASHAQRSGDHVVVTDNTYGGTFRLFDKVLTQLRAVEFSYVDTSQLELIEQAMRRRRRCCSSRRRPTR